MKPRTFIKFILSICVFVGLLLWLWQITTPDLQVTPIAPAEQAAKRIASSVNDKLPPVAKGLKPNPFIMANESTPQTISNTQDNRPRISLEATPLVGPPVPDDAHLTVPLENAEHHVFNLKSMEAYDASIIGYSHTLNSDGKDMETVRLYVWQNSGPAHIIDLSLYIGYFSPEDQDYIRNWARLQAASPSANQPSTAPPSIVQLRQLAAQMGIPLSSPDWVSQVQARMQSNGGATTPAIPESNSQTDVQSAPPQQGPIVITN